MKDYTLYDQPGPDEPDELDEKLAAFRAARGAAQPETELTVTHGVTVDPDSDDDRGVSNADIASAVRRHLGIAPHIPVTITDSAETFGNGEWSIHTTDITAEGLWGMHNGQILIAMAGLTTISYALEPPKPEPPSNIVSGLDVDEPDDGDVVNLERADDAVGQAWERISSMLSESLRRGDVDMLRQARDQMPALGQKLLWLLTAMNRGIERGEQQEEYERRNG